MVEFDPDVRAYYELGKEADRLGGEFPSGPLELVRTQEILLRYLAPPPQRILDVGGGPGVYAAWLADRGDKVHVIDPIPLHIDQSLASDRRVTASLGDARELPQDDASFDVVLLLGPLYHLLERIDRVRAFREARRVLRPGGLLFAAAISRYAALLDLLVRLDRFHEPDVLKAVEQSIATGLFPGNVGSLFTTAYFHRPRELKEEAEESGFLNPELFGVEGPGFLLNDFKNRWADPDRRDAMLHAARLVENDPDMWIASSHLMLVARRL